MSARPFLASEQHTKGSDRLPMTIALAWRRKCPCKAQRIAPHFHKLVQAVEAFDRFPSSCSMLLTFKNLMTLSRANPLGGPQDFPII